MDITPEFEWPEHIPQKDVFRFIQKIEIVEECWEWRGAHKYGDPLNYGFFSYPSNRLAHRVAYEWWIGPLVEGFEINHLCCNCSCVNPEHLEQITRHENLMKSEGITAHNAQKTCCPRGHPYDKINSQGRRVCRQCDRETLRRSRRRAKGLE